MVFVIHYKELFTKWKVNTTKAQRNEQKHHSSIKTVNKTMMGHARMEVSPNRPHQLKESMRKKFLRYGTHAVEIMTSGLNQTPINKTNNSISHIIKKLQHNYINQPYNMQEKNDRAKEEAEVHENE